MNLDLNKIKPLTSQYIASGYKKDNISIASLERTEDGLIACIDVDDFFIPSDGQYHFTAFHAQLVVSQLIIIHGCLTLGLHKKSGEAYMREFKMKLKKKINKHKGILVVAHYDKMRIKNKNAFINSTFSFEDKSFYGEISAVIPLDSEE
ncbi:MAG TPA: hypothetical protein VJK30_06990 [Coxiellaceae bacterium]|nr:MAG: hypothetical protein A3E81_07765 [Gammaproteobacteria bacterium RIFCSPHIGHO2_12_FULL_36_30]HLB57054.1 hypothetical protein [Coxiellaceae bacterium]